MMKDDETRERKSAAMGLGGKQAREGGEEGMRIQT